MPHNILPDTLLCIDFTTGEPRFAKVLTTSRWYLTVHEDQSINGLATVQTHGNAYLYRFQRYRRPDFHEIPWFLRFWPREKFDPVSRKMNLAILEDIATELLGISIVSDGVYTPVPLSDFV